MPFKKLNPELQKTLATLEIASPTPFQSKSIPVIKSGAHVYCIAPKDSGKTTTLILTTLQELKCRPIDNAPRAVVLVEDSEKALEVYEAFLPYVKSNSLRVYVAYEKLHIDVRKSEIFMGVDILIATPRSMKNLLLSNGVCVTEIKIFSVDDAEFLIQKAPYSDMMSITQSVNKCQFVIYSEKMEPMLKRFENHFMEYAKIVKV